MSDYLRCMVRMPFTTGLGEDIVVNDLYFRVPDKDTSNVLVDLRDLIEGAYAHVAGQLSGIIDRTKCTIRFYDLAQAKPSVPLDELPMALDGAANNYRLPQEMALCVSFQGDRQSGLNQRRRRGRIYLGPFCNRTPNEMSVDYERPHTSIITAAVNFGTHLLSPGQPTGWAEWGVLSRVNAGGWMVPGVQGPPDLPAGWTPVTNGWVDNAWDTQRRRGLAPSARTTFS